jgi:hypothetical protein
MVAATVSIRVARQRCELRLGAQPVGVPGFGIPPKRFLLVQRALWVGGEPPPSWRHRTECSVEQEGKDEHRGVILCEAECGLPGGGNPAASARPGAASPSNNASSR